MYMRVVLALLLLLVPIGLSGCSGAGGGGGASAPKLMTFSEHQKEELAARGAGIMGSAVDAVKGIASTGYAGEAFTSSDDGLWNAGKPFDGLKIDVSGDAFTQGILGPPTKCSVDVREEAGDQVKASSTVQFTTSGAAHYTALFPSVHCTRCISFQWSAPALRNGSSATIVSCVPADGSCPPITFNRGCAILPPIQHATIPAELPGAATATAPPSSDAAPKTQLEMGEQQSKSEQEEKAAKEELEKDEKDSQ
jgi:hypothetical protein